MTLIEHFEKYLGRGQFQQSLSSLSSFNFKVASPSDLSKVKKLVKALPIQELEKWFRRRIHVAIFSDSTVRQQVELLKLMLLAKQVEAQVDVFEYDVSLQILKPEAISSQTNFDICIIDLRLKETDYPFAEAKEEDIVKLQENVALKVNQLAESLKAKAGATVIVNGFIPDYRPSGNLDSLIPIGRVHFVRELNRLLTKSNGQYRFHDLDYLAASVGYEKWFDPRLWFHGKVSIFPDSTSAYIHSLSCLISSRLGLVKKCLVLDLDNTLWGGVVGDDDVKGLIFGEGDPVGEAYKAFQLFLKSLRSRGIILALCSKNEESVVRKAFDALKEMPLKLDDFSALKINWDTKSQNIKSIAKELNIGLDSMVFFDDNAFERNEVRANAPEVCVVETPEDPSYFIAELTNLNLFPTDTLTAEDGERASLYGVEKLRSQAETQFEDYESYLAQLDMTADIKRFNTIDLQRIVQLINKTNQFNLTTKRYSDADCERMMADENFMAITLRLKDRFGDSGLVSVFIGKFCEDEIFEIDTWLMSCRVFKRQVEHYIFDKVLRTLEKRKIKKIRALFNPTSKNGVVAHLYKDLGFKLLKSMSDGSSLWELNLPFGQFKTHIREANEVNAF